MSDKIGYHAKVSITRTADTNAYAAKDVIGAATGSTAAVRFDPMGAPGRSIRITDTELEIESTGLISGEAQYRLALYNVTPPSALGDNAPWDLPSGDRASFLGLLDLGTPVDEGSTLVVRADQDKQLKLGAGTELWGYLITVAAYTPTSARVYKATLHSVAL